jgi:hypothetical protein
MDFFALLFAGAWYALLAAVTYVCISINVDEKHD